MTDQLISFETAKLAREKGLPILLYFGWITKFYHPRTKSLLSYGRLGKCREENLYYAPTQSLLQKWLREVHKLIVCVNPKLRLEDWGYLYDVLDPTFCRISKGLHSAKSINHKMYESYEDALEAGLQESLKLI